jgi:hypothetical protein
MGKRVSGLVAGEEEEEEEEEEGGKHHEVHNACGPRMCQTGAGWTTDSLDVIKRRHLVGASYFRNEKQRAILHECSTHILEVIL